MGRIRTVKPEFFRHEGLFDLEQASGLPVRVAFAGLWTEADREGRFEWRPRRLKAAVLPYDDVDFGDVLDELARAGFVARYEVEGKTFGWIPTFLTHQVVNSRESASKLPAPPEAEAGARTGAPGARTCMHVRARGEQEGEREKERNGNKPIPEISRPSRSRSRPRPPDPDAGAGGGGSKADPVAKPGEPAETAAAEPEPSETTDGPFEPSIGSLRPPVPRARADFRPGDTELRSLFAAACRGLGLGLRWSMRYTVSAELLEREARAAGAGEERVAAVAAFYAAQCREATPSFERFAERFDHWRAALEASDAGRRARSVGALWDGIRRGAALERGRG